MVCLKNGESVPSYLLSMFMTSDCKLLIPVQSETALIGCHMSVKYALCKSYQVTSATGKIRKTSRNTLNWSHKAWHTYFSSIDICQGTIPPWIKCNKTASEITSAVLVDRLRELRLPFWEAHLMHTLDKVADVHVGFISDMKREASCQAVQKLQNDKFDEVQSYKFIVVV